MSRNYRNVDQTGNGYCGPLVLAAIIGCTTAEAAALVRVGNGARSVKGTNTSDLSFVLRTRGFRMIEQRPQHHLVEDRIPGQPSGVPSFSTTWSSFTPSDRNANGRMECIHTGGPACQFTALKSVGPTLAQWMRSKRNPDVFYIVELSGHWVLVRGRKFIDTATKGEWVFLRSAPHRRKRVKNVWMVS